MSSRALVGHHPAPRLLAPTVRVRRALAVAGCGVLTVTLSACESTEQESAKIGREGQQSSSQGGLQLGAVNHSVRVSDVTLLSSSGRTAVAVGLTASSSHPQVNVPLLVNVAGAGGKLLYSNATGGLEASLQHIALLAPGRQAWWVDDQLPAAVHATGVSVHVGSGTSPRTRSLPDIAVSGVHLGQQAGTPTLSGELVNHSSSSQSTLPVYAVALRGGRIVAAGRALVEALPAHSSTPVPFQIFLVGNPGGATLQVTVAPAVG